MREGEVIERLRAIATSPAARGLLDDVALLDGFVLTHDSIAEGVHFLPEDPPASVGWKLVAVNLSDLAAKGAEPAGALLSLTMAGAGEWELAFLAGIEAACECYGLALLGGDTIALPEGAARVLGLTAIGRAGPNTPARSGGKPGDSLWLIGFVGNAAAGLAQLKEDRNANSNLVEAFRRPVPLLAAGRILAPHAHAMLDVSDGLLLDASRMATASGCCATIELDALPLSSAFVAERGQDLAARIFAATSGDDYALLAAFAPGLDPTALGLPEGTRISRIGSLDADTLRLTVMYEGAPVELPERLGFEHQSVEHRRTAAPVAEPR